MDFRDVPPHSPLSPGRQPGGPQRSAAPASAQSLVRGRSFCFMSVLPFPHSCIHSPAQPGLQPIYQWFLSFCVNLVLPFIVVHLFPLLFAHTSFIRCVLRGSYVHLAAHSVHPSFIRVFIRSVIGSTIRLLTKVLLQAGLRPFTVPLFIPGFAHSFIFVIHSSNMSCVLINHI